MRAVAVRPGIADSLHVREVRRPAVGDVPGGRGVLVRVLRVGPRRHRPRDQRRGVRHGAGRRRLPDRRPREPRAGRGDRGERARVPRGPERLVVATVRRPGSSAYDAIGLQDMSTADDFLERGINRAHGYLAELYVDDDAYLVPLPESLGVGRRPARAAERRREGDPPGVRDPAPAARLAAGAGGGARRRSIGLLDGARPAPARHRRRRLLAARRRRTSTASSSRRSAGGTSSSSSTSLAGVAADAGPLDLILDATGSSPLAFEAADVLARNGVLVLASVTGGRPDRGGADRPHQPGLRPRQQGHGRDGQRPPRRLRAPGIEDLLRAEASFPGWLERLLTTRIDGLDRPDEMLRHLREDREAIKVYVQVALDG